jgi:hypothetical protein
VERLALGRTLATVATFSVVVVILLIVALSVQMAHGNDPALGPKAAAPHQPQAVPSEGAPTSQTLSPSGPAIVPSPPPAPDPAPVVTSVS